MKRVVLFVLILTFPAIAKDSFRTGIESSEPRAVDVAPAADACEGGEIAYHFVLEEVINYYQALSTTEDKCKQQGAEACAACDKSVDEAIFDGEIFYSRSKVPGFRGYWVNGTCRYTCKQY